MPIPLQHFANVQLGNAIRTHPAYTNTTKLPLDTQFIFVQYEVPFEFKDLKSETFKKDFSEWVYRLGTIGSGYRHVRCAVIKLKKGTEKAPVWSGTVWDFDDGGEGGKKKSAQRASSWRYNDPNRNDGSGSGYVFYGTTNMTDKEISDAAAGYVFANPQYTLTDNNCSKFAHFLANAINQTPSPKIITKARDHYAARFSVLSRYTQEGAVVEARVA